MLIRPEESVRAGATSEQSPERSATSWRPTPWPRITNLYRLHAFLVVAEELNFHRAAKRLGISQSPLSRMIKALESELGLPLFDRSRHCVRLTAKGAALALEARDILVHVETIVLRLNPDRAEW